jgi:hypothetical protein
VRQLFSEGLVDDHFRQILNQVNDEVGRMGEQALDDDEAAVVQYLVDKYQIACPALQPDSQLLEADEAALTVRPIMDFGRQAPARQVRAPRYRLTIPYEGDDRIFGLEPNPISWGGPKPVADFQPLKIVITWHSAEAASAEQIRAWFDEQVDGITGLLNQLRTNVDYFNTQQLPNLARTAVAGRRTQHQARRDTASALGFPLKRRDDADSFEVPVQRRKLTVPEPNDSVKRAVEYTLGDAEYEEALRVLEHQSVALERSPSLTEGLNEEQIRLLLLVGLNAVFEGQAMAEVFNSLGKTDILIRIDDNNAFVAECKIWDGPAKFADAIDQLLGYLTWRDTRAHCCSSYATPMSRPSLRERSA